MSTGQHCQHYKMHILCVLDGLCYMLSKIGGRTTTPLHGRMKQEFKRRELRRSNFMAEVPTKPLPLPREASVSIGDSYQVHCNQP